MEPYMHGRALPRYAAAFGAVALLITGCQPPNPQGDPPSASASSSTGSEMPHHMEGGIAAADPLPSGDPHPPELTPQQLYQLGEKSVFSSRAPAR